MATKRKIKKKQEPCGEGYKKVYIDPEKDPSEKPPHPDDPGTSSKEQRKYKCVKIKYKPGIKNKDESKPKPTPEPERPPKKVEGEREFDKPKYRK